MHASQLKPGDIFRIVEFGDNSSSPLWVMEPCCIARGLVTGNTKAIPGDYFVLLVSVTPEDIERERESVSFYQQREVVFEERLPKSA